MMSVVSTLGIQLELRHSMGLLKRQMLDARQEVQTGVMASPDLTLAEGVGRPLSYWHQAERLDAILDTNKIAATRLNATQTALSNLLETVRSHSASLTSVGPDNTAVAEASSISLSAMISTLNSEVSGEFLFAGINSGERPLDPAAGTPAGAEMDAAFVAYFGFSKSDPQASSVTATSFQTFLDTQIEPIFFGPAWKASISNASDEALTSRITLSETSKVSVSLNDHAIRSSVFSVSLSANFLGSPLGAAAHDVLVKKALSLSINAQAEIARLQSQAGFFQENIKNADERLLSQKDMLLSAAAEMTEVDPYAAATRLNSLLTQIETSYALTQKIQNLSILRFLG